MKNKLFKILLVTLGVIFVVSCSKKMPRITEGNKAYVADYLNDGFRNVDTLKDGRLEKSDVEKISANFNKPYNYNDKDIVNSIDIFSYGESFASPQETILKNFVTSFPSEMLDFTKDEKKISELRKQNPNAFKQTRADTRILRVDKDLVDAVLLKYANISSNDAKNKESVVYLEGDNSCYMAENDEGWVPKPAACKVNSKEIILEDDIKLELKLEEESGKFSIESFGLSPGACYE